MGSLVAERERYNSGSVTAKDAFFPLTLTWTKSLASIPFVNCLTYPSFIPSRMIRCLAILFIALPVIMFMF